MHNRVFLTTVYSCGLRLQEALHLQVSDIDSQRMMIHVHRGKQARDRYVPLPEETLDLLRKYWKTHKNQLLIFPALGRNAKGASTASSPMAIASVQGALRKARYEAGIEAITTCRTEAHGFTVYECDKCGKLHHIYRCCGNRHCPTCQNGKALDWLDRQLERQLPGHHFMITFTVPQSVRPFMRTHQKQAYAALFKASSQSIKKLAKNKKHIGGDIAGFTGILHT